MQRDERDEEYREVVERVPLFLSEISLETSRGRVSCGEVEESEADLERFRSGWRPSRRAITSMRQPASRPEQLFNNAVTR